MTKIGMAATKGSWWKRLTKTLLDNEASQLLREHGDRACEVVRNAARAARNKGERRQARHYSHLALRISELSGQKLSEPLTRAGHPLDITVPPLLARADDVVE
jgi:hypothetical protein